MNDEELIQRSAEERNRIFNRYEKGREEGAEIDAWEDPLFEIYHATDRYGFIHDKRLPSKVDPNEYKKQQIELERVKKWLKMLKSWDSAQTKEKLHRRIYKGIPNSLRSQVWCRLLNLDNVKEQNKGKYLEMCRLAKKWSTDARQIDSDVNRQFREHIHYRERYSIKQQSLFNVLTAYAMYNAEVGYCQGMSGLAGVLLMYMDEEDAFWAMSELLCNQRFSMHGLYIEGFPKLTRFLAHHDKILNKFMPKLKKHFDRHGLDAILYSLKWFFVCFVERVPFSLCLRVWDIYLLDGERVITAMAYTVLKLHKRAIMRLNDMDSITQYIQVSLYKDFGFDDDYVITNLEKSMEELKKAKLDYPGPPSQEELPRRAFGVFVEPTFERKIGRRAEEFSEVEKSTNENVIMHRDKTAREVEEFRESHISVSDGGELAVGCTDGRIFTQTKECSESNGFCGNVTNTAGKSDPSFVFEECIEATDMNSNPHKIESNSSLAKNQNCGTHKLDNFRNRHFDDLAHSGNEYLYMKRMSSKKYIKCCEGYKYTLEVPKRPDLENFTQNHYDKIKSLYSRYSEKNLENVHKIDFLEPGAFEEISVSLSENDKFDYDCNGEFKKTILRLRDDKAPVKSNKTLHYVNAGDSAILNSCRGADIFTSHSLHDEIFKELFLNSSTSGSESIKFINKKSCMIEKNPVQSDSGLIIASLDKLNNRNRKENTTETRLKKIHKSYNTSVCNLFKESALREPNLNTRVNDNRLDLYTEDTEPLKRKHRRVENSSRRYFKADKTHHAPGKHGNSRKSHERDNCLHGGLLHDARRSVRSFTFVPTTNILHVRRLHSVHSKVFIYK